MRSRLVAAVALLLVGIGAVVSPAQAAKPAPAYSVSVDQAAPRYGDVVTFTVVAGTPPKGWGLEVALVCIEGGTAVLQGVDGAAPYSAALTSPAWTSGPADCIAQLRAVEYRRSSVQVYDEVAFYVAE